MIRKRKLVLRHIIGNQHLCHDEQSLLQMELSKVTHDFLGGRPSTEAVTAEGVGHPSWFLRGLCLRGDSDDRRAVFKRDAKTPIYFLLLKILQQSSEEKDFI